MPSVSVATLVFGAGDSNSSLPTVQLKLVSERLTAGEIIAKTVAEQVTALQQLHAQNTDTIHQMLARHYLSADEIETQARSGKIALAVQRNPEGPDVKREIQRALRSFQEGYFRIFVDRQELRTADDVATLGEGSAITFVRLIPLAGG